jgi:hypothetical protein
VRRPAFDKDLRRAGILKTDATGRTVSYPSLRYFCCPLVGKVLSSQTVRLLMRHRESEVDPLVDGVLLKSSRIITYRPCPHANELTRPAHWLSSQLTVLQLPLTHHWGMRGGQR